MVETRIATQKEGTMNEASVQQQQRMRTERALKMLAVGQIHLEPDADGWLALDPDGGVRHLKSDKCDCEDFTRRCSPLRIRCKHLEALRIAGGATPKADREPILEASGRPPGASLIELFGAPFPAEAVHWKPQKVSLQGNRALAVAYLDAREVAQRLDEVVGPLGWQVVHQTLGDQLVTGIGIRDPATSSWIWKWDSGFVGRREGEDEREAGNADPRRRSEDEEKSRKGTLSDGLKRAAVLWGIGRYLYRLPKVWVGYDGKTKTLAETPHLPAWALPPAPVPGATVPAHLGAIVLAHCGTTAGAPAASAATSTAREPSVNAAQESGMPGTDHRRRFPGPQHHLRTSGAGPKPIEAAGQGDAAVSTQGQAAASDGSERENSTSGAVGGRAQTESSSHPSEIAHLPEAGAGGS
jgi:hypothetical protein